MKKRKKPEGRPSLDSRKRAHASEKKQKKLRLSYPSIRLIFNACRNIDHWILDFPTSDQNYKAMIYSMAHPMRMRLLVYHMIPGYSTLEFQPHELRFLEICAMQCEVLDPDASEAILQAVRPHILPLNELLHGKDTQ